MGVYFFATPSQGGKLTGEALAAGDERHPGVLPAAPNQELPCCCPKPGTSWFWYQKVPVLDPCRSSLLPPTALPRDFFVLVFFFTGLDIWTPVLGFPVLPPCLDSWISPFLPVQ